MICGLLSFQFLEISLTQLISHFRLNPAYSTTLAAHVKRYNKQLQNFKFFVCTDIGLIDIKLFLRKLLLAMHFRNKSDKNGIFDVVT